MGLLSLDRMTQRPIDAKSGVLAGTNTFASSSSSSSRAMSTPPDPSCPPFPSRRNRRIPQTPRSRPVHPSEPCSSRSVQKRHKRVHARTGSSKLLWNAATAWFWDNRRCSRLDPSLPGFGPPSFSFVIDRWFTSTSNSRIVHSHSRPQAHEVRTRCYGGLGYLPEATKTSRKRKPFRWRQNPVIHQPSSSYPASLGNDPPLGGIMLPDYLRDVYPSAGRWGDPEDATTAAPCDRQRAKPRSPEPRTPERPHC